MLCVVCATRLAPVRSNYKSIFLVTRERTNERAERVAQITFTTHCLVPRSLSSAGRPAASARGIPAETTMGGVLVCLRLFAFNGMVIEACSKCVPVSHSLSLSVINTHRQHNKRRDNNCFVSYLPCSMLNKSYANSIGSTAFATGTTAHGETIPDVELMALCCACRSESTMCVRYTIGTVSPCIYRNGNLLMLGAGPVDGSPY